MVEPHIKEFTRVIYVIQILAVLYNPLMFDINLSLVKYSVIQMNFIIQKRKQLDKQVINTCK